MQAIEATAKPRTRHVLRWPARPVSGRPTPRGLSNRWDGGPHPRGRGGSDPENGGEMRGGKRPGASRLAGARRPGTHRAIRHERRRGRQAGRLRFHDHRSGAFRSRPGCGTAVRMVRRTALVSVAVDRNLQLRHMTVLFVPVLKEQMRHRDRALSERRQNGEDRQEGGDLVALPHFTPTIASGLGRGHRWPKATERPRRSCGAAR